MKLTKREKMVWAVRYSHHLDTDVTPQEAAFAATKDVIRLRMAGVEIESIVYTNRTYPANVGDYYELLQDEEHEQSSGPRLLIDK